MSYANTAGDYFKNGGKLDASKSLANAIDIGASSGTAGEAYCVKPCYVRRIGFLLTEELAGGTSVAPTVVFKKNPTPLSSSGASTLGTLTIPDATAVGKLVYKDITPVAFTVGDALEVSWTVGTGTPTGIGHAVWIVDEDPETAANCSDMIASA